MTYNQALDRNFNDTASLAPPTVFGDSQGFRNLGIGYYEIEKVPVTMYCIVHSKFLVELALFIHRLNFLH
ncbi:hypothetical protein EYC84_008391 [Monilinia fructicola]|uniref:Uncharacterized protein n=1 Tax=Monilinia fructicola TaxID=38448 RepID=A0A5M9JH23_MONFR|nr:hypothetical protein EYC84_008391 [Monilinia fructicola]